MNERVQYMKSLLEEINPLQRMVNSPGIDKAFDIFKRELPESIIHEYPAGTEREDWIVPHSWEVIEGEMVDKDGNIIASIQENMLFVAPYSEEIEGWFSKEEIQKHLRTSIDRPDSFLLEHRNTYNFQLKTWGITLPHNRWTKLPEGKYFIKIKVKWSAGSMKVGEYFLPGKSNKTICFCAHIDELCNDDLSGCIIGMEIMHRLKKMTNRYYSYQLLWLPEMFGSLFYTYENRQKILNTIGMLNLEALGSGDQWCMKKSWQPNSRLEKILRLAMTSKKRYFKELEFFEGYVNDEKIYAWPKINVQGVSLQRFPFKEYHTSDDVPELIDYDIMLEAIDYVEKFVDILEKDYFPKFVNLLPPWLTRRNLYFDSKLDPKNHDKFNNNLLYNIDGKNSIVDLSHLIGLDFDITFEYLEKLKESGIITS